MYDVPLRMIDGKELRELEPVLKTDVSGAVHWTDTWACSDPGALTSALCRSVRQARRQFHQGRRDELETDRYRLER